jgi:hypothetical protein
LKGAVFRDASIDGLILPEEWTRYEFLRAIEEWGAVVCGLRDPGKIVFQGRCVVHWPENGHFYELIDEAVTFADARALATERILWGPFSTMKDGKGSALAPGKCLQGYLWTVGSAEEHDFVLGRFWRAEAGGLWLGASYARDGDRWRWVGGPEAGVTFWSGGPKGREGQAVAGQFENWVMGEPNDGIVERAPNPLAAGADGRREANEEDQAATSPGGWNDVRSNSRLRPVIEYGGIECPPG